MSEKITIETILDDAPAKAQQEALEAKNKKINAGIEENKKATKKAFTASMAAMRAGYMVMSGVTQAMGGSMSQAFSAIYGIAMASIGTYQSIAAAMAASGVGTVQAIMMSASLITAVIQLGAVSAGQEDFSRQVGGLNMALQGIGQSIGSWGV